MNFRNIVTSTMLFCIAVGLFSIALAPVAYAVIGASCWPMIPVGAVVAVVGAVIATSI